LLSSVTVTVTINALMLFSVPRDGNQGLENPIFRPFAIFRPRRTEKELRWLFSVPGYGHLA